MSSFAKARNVKPGAVRVLACVPWHFAIPGSQVPRMPTRRERWRFKLTRDHWLVECGGVGQRMTEMTWLDTFSGYRITFTRGDRWFSRWQEVRR